MKHLSEKTKKLLSEKQKLAIKEGRSKGWFYINSDINRRSYPEKWFIKQCLQKYDLYNRYTIKEKMSFGKYFLDFAFLELKLDVEIDGSQHITTQKAIEHDIQRDQYLIENGWIVYRIAWAELKKFPDKSINDFLLFLQEDHNLNRKYNVDEILNYININKPKYGTIQDYSKIRKQKSDEKYKKLIELILSSDINFSKYGWTIKFSKLTGIKNQKVNKWMKRYMPEFYENKCFKRKCTRIMPRFERGEM